jgi:uncharacterized protein involved in oxidation of intracellular sulfur
MPKQFLIIMNDGPYGNERAYNDLRLAMSLLKRKDVTVRAFLLGDAVQCAVAGQETPQGYYNIERMVRLVASRGAVAT